jgi:hypothetical protein
MNELRETLESLLSKIEDLRIEEERVADACSELDDALDRCNDLPEELRAQIQKLVNSDPDRGPNERLEDDAREALDALENLEDEDDEEAA